jgi:hypothetical protein
MRAAFRLSCLTAVVFALLAAPARATSNRIFISTTGNNANDCSNPLTPCVDFTGALSQVNTGGEIIAQATGPYGPLNITKAVTISGPPGVVIYSGHQITVNAPGATVILRGLTVDGNGASENGINVVDVGVLHVESCVIAGFAGSDPAHGNGISFAAGGQLFVKDTTIRNNGWVGIWVIPTTGTAKASINHCRMEGNGHGLISHLNAFTTVRDSVASGNSGIGLGAQFSPPGGELNIEDCLVANNVTGIQSKNGALVRVSDTTVTDNGTGIDTFPINAGTILSRGNNTVEGNGTDGSFSGTYTAK